VLLPPWQLEPSQQPVQQAPLRHSPPGQPVVEPSLVFRHWPVLVVQASEVQTLPSSQFWQAAPLTPHWPVVCVNTQELPLQHPGHWPFGLQMQLLPWQSRPLEHTLPLLPQLQPPLRQPSETFVLQTLLQLPQ
jgi:hypothetical protein